MRITGANKAQAPYSATPRSQPVQDRCTALKVIMKYTFYIFLILILCSCAVSIEKVAGTYLNHSGDTLSLNYDSTSIYNNRFIIREQLTSGATRENKGRWFYDGKNKQISFSTFTDSKIEYRHTIKKEKVEGKSEVRIYLADSDNLIPVYGLLPSKDREQMGIMGKFHGDMDYVTFDSKEYDKLQFQISHFKDFILDIPDTVNYTYIVRIYPEEYLYLLDNNSYKAKGSSIEPKIKADGKDRYRFKKSEVQPNL